MESEVLVINNPEDISDVRVGQKVDINGEVFVFKEGIDCVECALNLLDTEYCINAPCANTDCAFVRSN